MRSSTGSTTRRLLAVIAAGLLVLPLAACSSAGSDRSGAGGPDVAPGAASEPATGDFAGDGADAGAAAAEGEAAVDGDGATAEPSLIRTGHVSLEVRSPSDGAKRAAEIAERYEGQVESQNVFRAEGAEAAGAHLTLRVPAEGFEAALEELAGVGEVISQETSSADVTAEHVDLQARVRALEASVERLTELMSRSASTGELIEAETALSQRQQQLDGLQAQLDALEGQVDLATIEVSMSTKSVIPGGGPSNFWEGLGTGFSSLLGAGSGALVVLGILLPWLVVAGAFALIVLVIVRRVSGARRRRRAERADASPGAEAGGAADAGAAAETGTAADAGTATEVGLAAPLGGEAPFAPDGTAPGAAPGAAWNGWERPTH